tara:strand:+ start:5812 stop:6102 length:291 start_codon:yes stop_codon:yes gene_type:complete
MEVKHSKSFLNHKGYSIEWGYATWSKNETEGNKDWSIRNRYDKAYGGFNLRGSSEIPWEDFRLLIHESITEKQFTNRELNSIAWNAFKQRLRNIFS